MTAPIYLDYNATTPPDKEVIDALKPYIDEYFGNPASKNYFGDITKSAIDNARVHVASLMNCGAEEIIFTSGGTEANNIAIKGFAFAHKHIGNHIITSAIDHPAVLEVCRYLEKHGFEISVLPVNSIGMVNPEDVLKAIKNNTILISVMLANNETGAIQPISEITAIARSRNIFVHTDAAQAMGKIEVDVNKLGVDLLSVAGHKMYAPKGIGALYIRNGVSLEKVIHGAQQERGLRPGTANVLGIVGLGKACEIAKRDLEKNKEHLSSLRNRIYFGLKEILTDNIQINSDLNQMLPNTLNLSFKGVIANDLVTALQDKVVISAGAACHSGITKVSDVLMAMKVPQIWAQGAVRISVGRQTSSSEIEKSIMLISSSYNQLL